MGRDTCCVDLVCSARRRNRYNHEGIALSISSVELDYFFYSSPQPSTPFSFRRTTLSTAKAAKLAPRTHGCISGRSLPRQRDIHLVDHRKRRKAKPSARTSTQSSEAEAAMPKEEHSASASWQPSAALTFRKAASSAGQRPEWKRDTTVVRHLRQSMTATMQCTQSVRGAAGLCAVQQVRAERRSRQLALAGTQSGTHSSMDGIVSQEKEHGHATQYKAVRVQALQVHLSPPGARAAPRAPGSAARGRPRRRRRCHAPAGAAAAAAAPCAATRRPAAAPP